MIVPQLYFIVHWIDIAYIFVHNIRFYTQNSYMMISNIMFIFYFIPHVHLDIDI